MPRPTRIEYENAFYHVMNRGRGRQTIFHDSSYFQLFLETLSESHDRFDAMIHAYCLMGNHYHLLIETPQANLGRIMRHINGVYTQRYNRLKKTDGPLFRGRYKAILVDEDAYLLQLTRYIHRNPIEVKGSKVNLTDYKWSSYPSYIGAAPAPQWLCQEMTYKMLGRKQRYRGYRSYVEAGIDEDIMRYYNKGNIAAVLGDNAFRETVLEKKEAIEAGNLQAVLRNRPSLDTVVKTVATVFNLTRTHIIERQESRRKRNDARKIAMYYCQQFGDLSLMEIANGFGLSHVGSVSRLIHDAKLVLDEKDIQRQRRKIEKQLSVIQ
mgnify:CR=1 FL=1